jgi:hypothetical protein
MNRIETPGSTHTARPWATKRLARFFVVNRQSETGFSIRMLLRIVLVSARGGLRVYPQESQRLVGRDAGFARGPHASGERFASVQLLNIIRDVQSLTEN